MKKLILILFLLLIPLVSAVNLEEVHSITLLSVATHEDGSLEGKTAELYLQIKPGDGAVFIESYPLAQIDTQLSIKLANSIACSLATTDCSKFNFFYTIQADSSIVEGPSAGAATALLTVSALTDLKVDKSIAMTGMITSGGIVLPVDAIKEKVEAADNEGMKKVFIPQLALNDVFGNNSNESLTMKDFENLSLEIYPVNNLGEIIGILSGNKIELKKIDVPDFYVKTMKETQEELCIRTKDMLDVMDFVNETLFVDAKEYYENSINASDNKEYYSAASFCYSANVRLRELELQNLSQELLFKNYLSLSEKYSKFDEKINEYELSTFTDLETYMIVKERLIESKDYMERLNETNISSSTLSLAIERYSSAVAWSSFFGQKGVPLEIDEANLRLACFSELQRAEMISSYLNLFLPEMFLEDLSSSVDHARHFLNEQDYAMCLYTATKAKANGDYFMTSLGIGSLNQTARIVEVKLDAITKIISEQKNGFPIMGYSYLEYSARLLEEEPSTALLFAEFGLGFSDLSYYFPKLENDVSWDLSIVLPYLFVFLMGCLVGGLVMNLTHINTPKKPKKVPKKAN